MMLVLGIVFVAVALVLLVAEAHLSTGGLLAVGGAAAVVAGMVLLAAASAAGSVAVVAIGVGVAVVSTGGVALMCRGLAGARSSPRSGPTTIVGHHGVIRVTDTGPRVFVDGALWRAVPSPLDEPAAWHDGDPVIVEQMNGLTLRVRKLEELELSS